MFQTSKRYLSAPVQAFPAGFSHPKLTGRTYPTWHSNILVYLLAPNFELPWTKPSLSQFASTWRVYHRTEKETSLFKVTPASHCFLIPSSLNKGVRCVGQAVFCFATTSKYINITSSYHKECCYFIIMRKEVIIKKYEENEGLCGQLTWPRSQAVGAQMRLISWSKISQVSSVSSFLLHSGNSAKKKNVCAFTLTQTYIYIYVCTYTHRNT